MAVVREGETLGGLSARLGVPGCMLLRKNGLYSPAWLLPGREIDVPEGAFCLTSDFPCPAGAMHRPARDDTEDERHTTAVDEAGVVRVAPRDFDVAR